MDIKFEHRIWRTFANLVSEVQGPGYGKYRTTKIRLLLTVARRLEWVGNLSHFDAMLSEKADMYISTGRWSGTKQDAMRYLFYTFISDRAADYAKHFTFGKRDRRTPWQRELDRAKSA